ncbi:MAG TPA: hypothetical protein VJP05_06205 [Acidimicrobiia bacterium]|nr:hypothetical protein [Acidimicrobiia bacterium]
MTRRLIALAVVTFSVWGASAAYADEDLQDYLERASTAEFHAVGVVMCMWEPDSVAATYEVTRTDGMSMVHGPAGDLMLVDGLMAVQPTNGGWYAVEVGGSSDWQLADRYTLGGATPTTRLGRPASAFTVFEDGVPRLRMVVDDESRVPLLTEVLDGQGRVFRLATLIDFTSGPSTEPAKPESYGTHEMLVPTTSMGGLPASLDGYRRADTYGSPSGVLQGYYSDGLFSFSVFESKRRRTPDAFADATVFALGGSSYRRLVTPSHVWVQWDSPDRSYVLVGDLPPDHLWAVLAELPKSGNRGLFVRLWRRLFG